MTVNERQKAAGKQADVMIGFSEGKSVQYRFLKSKDSKWADTSRPSWNWTRYEYRVKPTKPRTFWVAAYHNECGQGEPVMILVREVVEDE